MTFPILKITKKIKTLSENKWQHGGMKNERKTLNCDKYLFK